MNAIAQWSGASLEYSTDRALPAPAVDAAEQAYASWKLVFERVQVLEVQTSALPGQAPGAAMLQQPEQISAAEHATSAARITTVPAFELGAAPRCAQAASVDHAAHSAAGSPKTAPADKARGVGTRRKAEGIPQLPDSRVATSVPPPRLISHRNAPAGSSVSSTRLQLPVAPTALEAVSVLRYGSAVALV